MALSDQKRTNDVTKVTFHYGNKNGVYFNTNIN